LFKRDTPENTNGNGNGNDDDEAYAAALHYLMHTPHGVALVRRFFGASGSSGTADIEHLARLVAHFMRASNSDETKTEKVHMDRDEVLKAAVRRDGGIVGLCKRICKQGAGDISEHELTALITEHAMREHPDMPPEGAFTKAYMSPAGEPLRRAIQITKGLLDIEPVAVGVGSSDTEDDSGKAYEQLQRLATEQRKRSPFLSVSQAFERVTRQRPDLLARAVPRR
jgi:hypothetical protein